MEPHIDHQISNLVFNAKNVNKFFMLDFREKILICIWNYQNIHIWNM